MAEDTVLFLRDQVSTLQQMLKDMLAKLWNAKPDVASAFKAKHRDFSSKLIESSQSRQSGKGTGGGVSQPAKPETKKDEWKQVKKPTPKVKEGSGPTSAAIPERDILSEEGWSRPVLKTLGQVGPPAEGVYLATKAEAKQLATEVRSKGALAVLSPSQVGDEEEGSRTAVLATDKSSRQQFWQRWLL